MSSNSLGSFVRELRAIQRGGSKRAPKPHKLIMLLAVLDLLESGDIVENRVVLNPQLISKFECHFRIHAGGGDWCQPAPPFFHLRTSRFWKHQVVPGREDEYAALTRVGAGVDSLKRCVAYAYFERDAYLMLREREARNAVREVILDMLNEDMQEQNTRGRRVGLAFSEGFALSIPSIVQVLNVVTQHEHASGLARLSRELLATETTLGPNYLKAMPRYCVGAGLLDGGYQLTRCGRAVRHNDPSLLSPTSAWVMHYHLSTRRGPGPEFWHYVITAVFRPGETIQSRDVQEAISRSASEGGTSIKVRTSRNAATAVLGTYSKSDSLGILGLLTNEAPGQYRVLTPSPPPLWVFAYALADYWSANWGAAPGVNLTSVSEEGGIASIFMMGSGLVGRYLAELQREGFAEVQRRKPPFQLTRNWANPEVFLERIYD